MPTPTVYLSTDTSAPEISRLAGSLVDALYEILVTGYGSKPAAGWTRPYSGTNKAVFRQGGGRQRYVRVDDATGSEWATAMLYASMSSLDVGDGACPIFGTYYWNKSALGTDDPVPWMCIATARSFYMIIQRADATFGDGTSNDTHIGVADLLDPRPVGTRLSTFIVGSGSSSAMQCALIINNHSAGAYLYHVLLGEPDGFTGPGGSAQFGKRACGASGNTYAESGHASLGAYPDAASGKLPISRYVAMERGTYNRIGFVPGLWFSHCNAASLTSLDTFSGSGSLAGREFLIACTRGDRVVIFETTGDSWT